jgi:L-rhamnose mutarotase
MAYVEYAGDNFDSDMARMAAEPDIQRWWKETDPCQAPLPDALAKGNIWAETTQVFHFQPRSKSPAD